MWCTIKAVGKELAADILKFLGWLWRWILLIVGYSAEDCDAEREIAIHIRIGLVLYVAFLYVIWNMTITDGGRILTMDETLLGRIALSLLTTFISLFGSWVILVMYEAIRDYINRARRKHCG